MAVVDAEIIIYGCATMGDDDTATQIGGAISLVKRVVFTDISPDGIVEMVSSNGADSMNATLFYVKDDGTVTSETKAINGTTAVDFTDTVKTILKIVLASAAAGIVTFRKDGDAGDFVDIEAGVTEIRRAFYNVQSEASGGSTRTYYEKVFIKNTNATDALTSGQIVLQADPEGVITFALETSLDGTSDNGAGNDRQTAPSGFTFDATTKNIANSQVLSATAAQGMWLKLTLAAATAPTESTFTIRTQGVAA